MAIYNLNPFDFYFKPNKDGEETELMKTDAFNTFNEGILGLGKIDTESEQINAISVIFDLEGFTNFCKQIDPQLAVPEYLSDFLKWIFSALKTELTISQHDEGFEMWANFPFLSKYLGDGILFLWNTNDMEATEIHNIIVSMYDICEKYKTEFLPAISKKVVSPPPKLRCGIARGAVYSVGDGNDFVGPCINMSARLQKLHGLSFCFSKRGTDLEKMGDSYKEEFIVMRTDIRGIGSDELVCILKSEYNKLPAEDKNKFKNI